MSLCNSQGQQVRKCTYDESSLKEILSKNLEPFVSCNVIAERNLHDHSRKKTAFCVTQLFTDYMQKVVIKIVGDAILFNSLTDY